jgi:hypothetical protein
MCLLATVLEPGSERGITAQKELQQLLLVGKTSPYS